ENINDKNKASDKSCYGKHSNFDYKLVIVIKENKKTIMDMWNVVNKLDYNKNKDKEI
ncbi:8318_t:CDS:2, partial [Gigaspora margarita]